MRKILVSILVFLALSPQICGAAPVIGSINITGNRVRESIIRKNLGFSEGDEWNASLAGKAKLNLFRLKVFKELDIEAVPSAASDTVAVNVRAIDGWYIFPLPMVTSKGGEQTTMLMLAGHNVFRGAERISLFTAFRGSSVSSIFMFSVNDYSLNFGEWNTSDTEYAYGDGGFSRHVFAGGSYKLEPEDLGTVAADYKRESSEAFFTAGKRVADGIRASAGVRSARVKYAQGSAGGVPSDSGTMNSVTLGLKSEEMDTVKDSDGFGRMFGLGMAEVRELIRTGKKEPSLWLWSAGVESSGKAVSSDFPYTKATLSVARKTVFGRRNSLTASTRLTSGTSLPFSRMAATNQQDGLRGYYAREFRGEAVVNSFISYTHPLRMTMTGYFSMEGFCDWGINYSGDTRKDRTGAGFHLSYRFWRFPIPVGFGYAYSFDDENWQSVFSVGGRF